MDWFFFWVLILALDSTLHIYLLMYVPSMFHPPPAIPTNANLLAEIFCWKIRLKIIPQYVSITCIWLKIKKHTEKDNHFIPRDWLRLQNFFQQSRLRIIDHPQQSLKTFVPHCRSSLSYKTSIVNVTSWDSNVVCTMYKQHLSVGPWVNIRF